MSNGKTPLMLMMALSMPGAVHALGLGDIHVDSGLNERLAAEIDIVGATAADLNDLQAAVANRETFLRYGAERPAFLSSATFKVTHDSQGRPVLAVRSTDAFTEPLVNFLVDLHWRNGELVRQYTLLLDPPGFAAATPTVETKTQTVARQADPPTDQLHSKRADRTARKITHIKVGAKATLRGIAWRVGERSPSDLQKMTIALFRANPSAFGGNINRLRLGAVLTVPSFAELAALSKADAKREFHAQMAAWHSPARTLPAIQSSPASITAMAALPPAVAAPPVEPSAAASAAVAPVPLVPVAIAPTAPAPSTLAAMQQQVAPPEKTMPITDASVPPDESGRTPVPLIAGVGLLAAALAALYLRLRRRAPKSNESGVAAAPAPARTPDVRTDAPNNSHVNDLDATHLLIPAMASPPPMPKPVNNASVAISRPQPEGGATLNLRFDTTVKLPIDDSRGELTRVDSGRLDYNFVDLEMTAQHVHMPSVLNDRAVVKERRTNLADVLKMAIEREPDRHDLRMKLLELYYSAAATNRQAFLEVVQKFARDRDYLQVDQWEKIAFMGRQIASENPMFAEQSAADDDLADCA